jgi:hypothetical protein
MSTEEYLDALKTLYMPAYSRTTARELGMKVKEAEAIANGAPLPEPVAMRVRMKLAIYYRWKALWDARKAVKEELRDKGIKPSRFTAAEITGMARERVEREKARAQLEQNSQHSCQSQRPAAQAVSLHETHAQNGATR